MKKGRPAHTLHVLGAPGDAAALEAVVFAQTTTLGVRRVPVTRTSLERAWVEVDVAPDATAEGPAGADAGSRARPPATVRIKVGHRAGRLVVVTPEFDDVLAAAAARTPPRATCSPGRRPPRRRRVSSRVRRGRGRVLPRPASDRRRQACGAAICAARWPAPYPLSMLTTATPGAHALSMVSRAARPSKAAP